MFKRVLRLIASIGIAIGYGCMMLVIWLVSGNTPKVKSDEGGIDYALLALSVGLAFAGLVVSALVHLILHEAGHLIAGLLTGFRFLSFRVFKLTLIKTDEGLKWKRFHIAGTGGQCLLDLPPDQDVDKAPWFWYNAGGVLMNVLLVVLAIVCLRLCQPGIVALSFLLMMAFVGIFFALVNGIPMKMGGVANDGHNLLSLWQHPEQRPYFVRTLQMAGRSSRGQRLSELPAEWFSDDPVTAESSYLQLYNRVNYLSLLEDQGRLEEARTVAEELMSLGKKLPQMFQWEVGGERVMLELLTLQRKAVVDELWTKTLQQYTEVNSKYSPIKCAVLFAVNLLHLNDPAEADTYKQTLLEHQLDFTMPGEARTAIFLVGKAEEKLKG